MLEQLDVRPGHRVLEIGTASGINAGLLADLTGPCSLVTTIEIDPELTGGARSALVAAGYGNVEVISGDGALGHPGGAPAVADYVVASPDAWMSSGPECARAPLTCNEINSYADSACSTHPGGAGVFNVDDAVGGILRSAAVSLGPAAPEYPARDNLAAIGEWPGDPIAAWA